MTAPRFQGRLGDAIKLVALALGLVVLGPSPALAQPELLFEVPWDGDLLTFSPADPERQARGPTAVGLAPNGTIWILDPLAHRLQGFDRSGRLLATVPTPDHHNDLVAVDPRGGFALYAPHLRRLTWLDASGVVLATRSLPLHLSAIRALDFTASGELEMEDPHGQRFRLGFPEQPPSLRAMLLARHHGPPGSLEECGLQKDAGRFLLRRWTAPSEITSGREPKVAPETLALGTAVSARLVSPCGPGSVLAEVELLGPGPAISVERQVAIISAGAVRDAWTMPGDWPFVPAGRFASTPGEVVLIHPQPAGLQVWRWRRP